MGVAKKQIESPETLFLRDFAKDYAAEVAFTPKAEVQMRLQLVSLACVHQVMRTGEVVISEKDSAECSMWVVQGENCNNDEISITLEVIYDRYQMCVLGVRKI